MSETYVQGTVRQVIPPEDVDDYAVGTVGQLFGEYGYSVVVVVDERRTLTLLDRVRTLLPWTNPSHTYDVLVDERRKPADVVEGATVSWAAETVDDQWYVVPSNPLQEVPVRERH